MRMNIMAGMFAAINAGFGAPGGAISRAKLAAGGYIERAYAAGPATRSRWPGHRGRSGAKLRRMAAEGRIGLGHPQ